MPKDQIYQEISQERQRQDERWGGPSHDDKLWPWQWTMLRAQQEEQIYLIVTDARPTELQELRARLLCIAALCVAQVEALDREVLRTNQDVAAAQSYPQQNERFKAMS